MKINYQCSNCGRHFVTTPMAGIGHGMYFAGARAVGDAFYCEDCVKSWPERNGGKEFDEEYKEPFKMFAHWWNNQCEQQKPKEVILKVCRFKNGFFEEVNSGGQ